MYVWLVCGGVPPAYPAGEGAGQAARWATSSAPLPLVCPLHAKYTRDKIKVEISPFSVCSLCYRGPSRR